MTYANAQYPYSCFGVIQMCHALKKFHSNANLYAQIWLGLGADIVCVIAVLNLIKKYFDQPSKQETDAIELRNEKRRKQKSETIIFTFSECCCPKV